MASLSTATDGEITEFKRRLGRAGFSAEIIREVNRGDDNVLATTMYEALMRHPRFTLVHGVFTKQDNVLAAFKARCAAKDINFGKFSWVGPETAPDFDPDDPETVVVLDATLDTLQNTFEFAWAWTVDGQDDKWRWDGMVSDASKLRLLSDERPDDAEGDSPEFKPWTISWRRIKLNTFVGKKPGDVRNAKSSPGCALLFVAAEHPARIKATDYKTRFGFWLAGLKCTAPDEEPWQDVPYVSFNLGHRQVELSSDPCPDAHGHLAVPSFRE
ncbi:hypothetical protein HYW17_01020 [Candidatus Uhrbacteria bacterium]|nr:hypothetical protein [Candidatus Uhrbacteria bacterium]